MLCLRVMIILFDISLQNQATPVLFLRNYCDYRNARNFQYFIFSTPCLKYAYAVASTAIIIMRV